MSSKDMSDVVAPLAIGMQSAGAIMGAGGAYAKSAADRNAYNMQAEIMDNNAAIAGVKRGDAFRRGEQTAFAAGLKARQVKGQQIATMAANGVALDEGSPLNILTDTDFMTATDANVIALNAAKEAWGYDVEAQNARSNASLLRNRASMESPGRAAATSLLTSAGSVASKWYSARHPYGLGT